MQSSGSSASPRGLSLLVSGTDPIATIPAGPTTDQDISDGALYSPAGSMNRATGDLGDLEKLGYPGHTGELVYPGHTGEIGYPGHTEELVYPGHTGEIGYPGHSG